MQHTTPPWCYAACAWTTVCYPDKGPKATRFISTILANTLICKIKETLFTGPHVSDPVLPSIHKLKNTLMVCVSYLPLLSLRTRSHTPVLIFFPRTLKGKFLVKVYFLYLGVYVPFNERLVPRFC